METILRPESTNDFAVRIQKAKCLLLARNGAPWTGRACPLCPGTSDINLFCYRESIIHLDPKVSNRALYFGVTEQELDRTKIPGAAIDQRCLRPPQRVGAVNARIETDVRDPFGDEPGILPGRHALARGGS